jgi:hypothetical protein
MALRSLEASFAAATSVQPDGDRIAVGVEASASRADGGLTSSATDIIAGIIATVGRGAVMRADGHHTVGPVIAADVRITVGSVNAATVGVSRGTRCGATITLAITDLRGTGLPVADLLGTGSVNTALPDTMAWPGTTALSDTDRPVTGWVSIALAADGSWPSTDGVNGDRADAVARAGPDLPGRRCVAPTRGLMRSLPPPTQIRTAS